MLAGCGGDGVGLRSWWGPVAGSSGQSSFAYGGSFAARGLVHSFTTQEDGVERDYLGVVLVGGDEGAATCSVYVDYLRRVQQAQDYIEEFVAAGGTASEPGWSQYVCQTVRGAAVEAFGQDGAYRAVHALLDVTGGGVAASDLFPPASLAAESTDFPGAEVLTEAGTYVTRVYERSLHGDGILPGGETPDPNLDVDPITGCSGYAAALLEELAVDRDDYPDRHSVALQAGTHRYYHQHTTQESIALDEGDPLDVGFRLPGWQTAGVEGTTGSATLLARVSRAHETFPYEQILLSSQDRTIEFDACPLLSQYVGLVWPELGPPPDWLGELGDDDDSAE